MEILKRIRLALLILAIVVLTGVLVYKFAFTFTWLDALYMTIITISTVGFGEVVELPPAGRIFTIFLIVAGVGSGLYAVGVIAEFMFEGHLRGVVGRRRMEKEISKLKNHYIVCGYGRVGSHVVKELETTKAPFVVVENSPEIVKLLKEERILVVEGDASQDEVLERARLESAKGLVAAVDNDAENMFVTLSARKLNPGIFIVARADVEESEDKLKKAGADRVVLPAAIGGRRMASLMIRPLVCDYLGIVSRGRDVIYELAEVVASKASTLAESSIQDSDIRGKTGALVLAIKKESGKINTNPPPSTLIEEKDILVVMGTRAQIESLEKLASVSK